ncbi:MAG TPA: hypothetical protein VHJ58_16170 [Vicinamibacterales bacterium]|nr:hypothetical protein [Vicinamibacterales bacterium]
MRTTLKPCIQRLNVFNEQPRRSVSVVVSYAHHQAGSLDGTVFGNAGEFDYA